MSKAAAGWLLARTRDAHMARPRPSFILGQTFTTGRIARRAEPRPVDAQSSEEIEKILREYGVDPEQVGDRRQEEKKRNKGVEDYKAWKEWDGLEDKKQTLAALHSEAVDSSPRADGDSIESKVSLEQPVKQEDPKLRKTDGVTTLSNRTALTSPHTPLAQDQTTPTTLSFRKPQHAYKLRQGLEQFKTEAHSFRSQLSDKSMHMLSRALVNIKALETNARRQFGLLGGSLNEVTGYNEVDKLKKEVTTRGRFSTSGSDVLELLTPPNGLIERIRE